MRELTYYVATSLDGRIAGPGDDWSPFLVDGDHQHTLVDEYRDTIPGHVLDAIGLAAHGSRFDTVLMGWNTYATALDETRSPYPHLRQLVFSRSHAGEDVPDSVTLTAEDPARAVRQLKDEAGPGIWLCGGGVLASALGPEIDRLVLKVNPVVLGDGPPLFAPPYAPTPFELTASRPFRSGVVVNEYRRAT